MSTKKHLHAYWLLFLTFIALNVQPAVAKTYDFNGVVTLCTGTCDSFASLALGTEVTGSWEIDTVVSGSWSFSDFGPYVAEFFNPATSTVPFDGSNPASANPLPLNPTTAAIRDSGGSSPPMITAGTTDASNQLNSGSILHEFVVPPFSSNGAWVIFEIGPGGSSVLAKLCLFFATSGCIPGATEFLIVEGTFALRSIDSDNDGVEDMNDNCINRANPDQRDGDTDGIGTACDPDHNQDCVVNFLDLALLDANFFGSNDDYDYSGDGVVNFLELGRMKEQFFMPPGPSALGCN